MRQPTRPMTPALDQRRDPRVALVELASPSYGSSGTRENQVARGVAALADLLGWSAESLGPFGRLIPPAARVLVKPNWVMHCNRGPWGIEPLLTHASVVRAVVDGVLQANPGRLVLGDAPLQGCDFQELLRRMG